MYQMCVHTVYTACTQSVHSSYTQLHSPALALARLRAPPARAVAHHRTVRTVHWRRAIKRTAENADTVLLAPDAAQPRLLHVMKTSGGGCGGNTPRP